MLGGRPGAWLLANARAGGVANVCCLPWQHINGPVQMGCTELHVGDQQQIWTKFPGAGGHKAHRMSGIVRGPGHIILGRAVDCSARSTRPLRKDTGSAVRVTPTRRQRGGCPQW